MCSLVTQKMPWLRTGILPEEAAAPALIFKAANLAVTGTRDNKESTWAGESKKPLLARSRLSIFGKAESLTIRN